MAGLLLSTSKNIPPHANIADHRPGKRGYFGKDKGKFRGLCYFQAVQFVGNLENSSQDVTQYVVKRNSEDETIIGEEGTGAMATNFEISIHQNSNAFHLKLVGDFDRNSAYDLLHVLQRSCGKASKVFIHTSRLKQINPFGRSVLHNNLQELNSLSIMPLVFTGKNATQLAPYEVRLISSL